MGTYVSTSSVWSSTTLRPTASATSPALSSSQPSISLSVILAPPQATMFSGFAPCSQYAFKSAAVIGVPSWNTASSRSFIVQTVKSWFEVMAAAIQGSKSPFSLSMNGVPNTWAENSLLSPPSRHGAIVLRIRPGAVTTCESCRSTSGTTGLGRGWTRPVAAVGVTAGAAGVGGSAAGCGGSGVSAGLGASVAVGATAGRDGVGGSAGCTTATAGVGGSAGSSLHPTTATTTTAAARNGATARVHVMLVVLSLPGHVRRSDVSIVAVCGFLSIPSDPRYEGGSIRVWEADCGRGSCTTVIPATAGIQGGERDGFPSPRERREAARPP